MTFLHKLSQRLARLKDRNLIAGAAVWTAAAILGCEQPSRSTEPIAPTASQLIVSPKAVTLQQDQTQDFMAVGLTSTGDTAPVSVTWSTTGGSVSNKGTNGGRHYGQYKGGVCGNYTVTATGQPGNVSGTASVGVTCPGTVAAVVVTPTAASGLAGQTLQLTATPQDSAGHPLSGWTVTWSSSNTAVATVNGTGVIAGVAAGSATIMATSGGGSGTSGVTVTNNPVRSVSVTPAAASVTVGQSVQLAATLKDSSGNVLTGRTVAWATNAAGVATVSASGLVTGVAVGAATVTATSEGQSGTATITVTAATNTSPGTVTALAVASVTDTSVTLSFTEVTDGTG